MEKFGAIHPTDIDDISQNTPNLWPVFEFLSLKNVGKRLKSHLRWSMH